MTMAVGSRAMTALVMSQPVATARQTPEHHSTKGGHVSPRIHPSVRAPKKPKKIQDEELPIVDFRLQNAD